MVGFTLTVVNVFRRFLSQFSTNNCHEILQALFSYENFIDTYCIVLKVVYLLCSK